MSITNTIATYLIILAYINFTKFENLIKYCCCRPRLTSLSLWRLVIKRFLRGRIRKDSSLFFFTFFFLLVLVFFFSFFFGFFFWGGVCFFFFGGGVLFSVSDPWVFFLLFFWGGVSFFLLFLGSRGLGGGGGGSGTPWLVTSALQGYYQIIMVVNWRRVILGEGTNHHYYFLAHHVALKLRCWHLQFHDLQLSA